MYIYLFFCFIQLTKKIPFIKLFILCTVEKHFANQLIESLVFSAFYQKEKVVCQYVCNEVVDVWLGQIRLFLNVEKLVEPVIDIGRVFKV